MSFYTPPAATQLSPSAGATITPPTQTSSGTSTGKATTPAQASVAAAAQLGIAEGFWTLLTAWILMGLMNMPLGWIPV
jgi:hypothetical protein